MVRYQSGRNFAALSDARAILSVERLIAENASVRPDIRVCQSF
jgi:hypothetical protein